MSDSVARWLPTSGAERVFVGGVDGALDALLTAGFTAHIEPVATPLTSAVELLAHVLDSAPNWAIAFVDARADVSADWDALLIRALIEESHVGVVSPLSDDRAEFSPFPGPRPDSMSAEHVNRWLSDLSRLHLFDVRAVLAWCACFRRPMLAEVFSAHSLPTWAALETTLLHSNWSVVGCDWLFIGANASCLEGQKSTKGLQGQGQDPRQAQPLARLRHAFTEAGEMGESAVPPARHVLKPVQLHIAHSWGGGLNRWVADMCTADNVRWNLVLRSIGTWGAFGQRLALYRSHEMDRPMREWVLDLPISSVAVAHFQYRHVLTEILRDYRVDALLISSLIGHSLDAMDMTLPTTFVAHDYFPFCPALIIHFGDVCTDCGSERLAECFADNPLNKFFSDSNPSHWTAVRRRFQHLLKTRPIHMAAPSRSVARHLGDLMPPLRHRPINIIPHGTTLHQLAPRQRRPGRLRIMVLGSLAPHKGRELLRSALPELTLFADVSLIGCGHEGLALESLVQGPVVSRYELDALPALVAEVDPDVGLLLSIVPETFSYTLSELWAMEIPPVATRLGVFLERICEAETGFLIDPDAASLVRLLRKLDADPAALRAVRDKLKAMPVPSLGQMVAEYHQLLPLGPYVGVPGPTVTPAVGERPQKSGVLYVDQEATFRAAARDFLRYARHKTTHSPQLGRLRRKSLLAILRLMLWFLR